MLALLDPFIPNPDIREKHQTVVQDPKNRVMDVARNFDMQLLPMSPAAQGRPHVSGAACLLYKTDVTFSPIRAEQFVTDA